MSVQLTIASQSGPRPRPRRLRPGLATPVSTQYTKTETAPIDREGQLESRRADYTATADYAVREDDLNDLSAVSCDWLRYVEIRLDEINVLSDGWDSYGAPSPNPDCVEAGRELIKCLAQAEGLPQPHVNPTRNGGVQFEWEVGDRYFELEIVAERAATYLYCDDAAHVEETGNVFEGESLESVLACIRRVAFSQ